MLLAFNNSATITIHAKHVQLFNSYITENHKKLLLMFSETTIRFEPISRFSANSKANLSEFINII